MELSQLGGNGSSVVFSEFGMNFVRLFEQHEENNSSMIDDSVEGNRLHENPDGSIGIISKTPAEVFGERVLRPLINVTCSLFERTFQVLTRTLNFLPGAAGEETNAKEDNSLITLSEKELTALKDIPAPSFCENIFDPATNSIAPPDESKDDWAQWATVQAYIKNGDIEIAIKLAKDIPSKIVRGNALWDIVKAYIKNGDIENAIKLAEDIPIKATYGGALSDTVKVYIKNGDIENVIKLAEDNPIKAAYEGALWDISKALAGSGEFNRAITMANSIQDVSTRGNALYDISRLLAEAGKIEDAITVANSIQRTVIDCIHCTVMYNFALGGISNALVKPGAFKRAIIMANSIQDVSARGFALDRIFWIYLSAYKKLINANRI